MASIRTMARPELQYHSNGNPHMRSSASPTRSSDSRRSPNPSGSPSRRHIPPDSGDNLNPSPQRNGPIARIRSGDDLSRSSNASSTGISEGPGARRRHGRESRHKLSSALRVANDAVLLDHNAEYEQAIEAYEESCRLLSEAIAQSETEVDRRKLMDIRQTYTIRVDELRQVQDDIDPSRRESQFDLRASLDAVLDEEDMYPVVETAVATKIQDAESNLAPPPPRDSIIPRKPVQVPRPLAPKKSLDNALDQEFPNDGQGVNGPSRWPPRSEFESAYSSSKSERPDFSPGHQRQHTSDTEIEFDAALDAAVEAAYMEGYEPYRQELFDSHAKRISHRFSLVRSAQALNATEERINAEREAKIKAARAQILEERLQPPQTSAPPPPVGALDEEEEEEERLLDNFTASFTASHQGSFNSLHSRHESVTDTTGSASVGRQSDSSAFSGQTFHSSVTSSLTSPPPANMLSIVEEDAHLAHVRKKSLPPPPPPETPTLGRSSDAPETAHLRKDSTNQTPSLQLPLSPTVRERRLSAKAAKALKITTPVHPDDYLSLNQPLPHRTTSAESLEPSKIAPASGSSAHLAPDGNKKAWNISSPFPSPLPTQSFGQASAGASEEEHHLERTTTAPDESARVPSDSPPRMLQRPSNLPPLKQSASSLSLRNHSSLAPSLTLSPSEHLDPSPSTPISFAFNTLSTPVGRGGPMAPMNTPANFSFQGNLPPPPSSSNTEALIFDSELHSPEIPGHPNPEAKDAPKQLEPCPESTLLRPYWLLRCFYQTLAHPRGGYLSQKLFIPRDVWKAKNVKLKYVEEKISACDLVTAALLKLGAVDTYDADAVLEELQTFENVLDQAQKDLSKKLGAEVGYQTVSSLFKDAPTVTSPGGHSNPESHAGDHTSGGARSSSKGYFSFRKLRGKGSTVNLAGQALQARDSGSQITMSTVPMTSLSTVGSRALRHQTYTDVKYIGPNGTYMGALARLCDAAQVLDQIARQVEDPGLRHSSPTHVGLELSSRHAAEFFGFYVCRFILQDVIMLSEKYIKKASEWVLT